MDIIGYIASILLSFRGVPQVSKSRREGHSNGISRKFLGMYIFGEILMLWYVISKHGFDIPLIVNYSFNIFFMTIVAYYKFFGKNREK